MSQRLRAIPLFADLPDEEVQLLSAAATEVPLGEGEVLFEEGAFGDSAYVILEGEIEIITQAKGREVLLAVRRQDEVIGEMALLRAEPRSATARARVPALLLRIPKKELDTLLDTSAQATKALFRVLLERWQSTESRLRQSERMAQLGTLTAGLAHELNNPAAAVERSAGRIREFVDRFAQDLVAMATAGIPHGTVADLVELFDQPFERSSLDALARSDLELDVEDWLTDHGVPTPWDLAPDLVEAGVDADRLAALSDRFGEHAPTVLPVFALQRRGAGLIHEVEVGASRLSAIVKALKGYAYLDQAPIQEITITDGIEDTLLILAPKLRDVEIVRRYGDIGTIEAYGSELNQVWTNLLDNAADAVHMTDGPHRITIRTHAEDGWAIVEIEDNGPGIPPDIQHRVFDSFFTTKEPGKGTGLGLDISYAIIADKHGGDLSFDSEPGRTTFRVRLPCNTPVDDKEMPTVAACEHLENVNWDPLAPAPGCAACLETGDTWVHLRRCLTCDVTLCCNDSPNQHAQAHAGESGHPTIRSAEPNEDWAWCYLHDTGIRRR